MLSTQSGHHDEQSSHQERRQESAHLKRLSISCSPRPGGDQQTCKDEQHEAGHAALSVTGVLMCELLRRSRDEQFVRTPLRYSRNPKTGSAIATCR